MTRSGVRLQRVSGSISPRIKLSGNLWINGIADSNRGPADQYGFSTIPQLAFREDDIPLDENLIRLYIFNRCPRSSDG